MEQSMPQFVEVRSPLPRNPAPEPQPIVWEPYRRSTRWKGLRLAPHILGAAGFVAVAIVAFQPLYS